MKTALLTKLSELSAQVQDLKEKVCFGSASPGDVSDIEHKLWDIKTTVANYDFTPTTIIVRKKKKKFFGPKPQPASDAQASEPKA